MTKQKEIAVAENTLPIEQAKTVTALQVVPDEKPLIPDERITQYFEEAIDCITEDRQEANNRYLQMADMVCNGGDPSSATKEAMVNLLKIKSDGVTQMTRILDLWTRLKLKEKASTNQIYAYQQNNKFESASAPSQRVRELIKMATDLDRKE